MAKDTTLIPVGETFESFEQVRKKLRVTSKQLSYLIMTHEIVMGVDFDSENHLDMVQFIYADSEASLACGQTLKGEVYRRCEQAVNNTCNESYASFKMLGATSLTNDHSIVISGVAGGFWRFESIVDVSRIMSIDSDKALSLEITPYYGEIGYPSHKTSPNSQWLIGCSPSTYLSDVKIPASEVERLVKAYQDNQFFESVEPFPVSKTRNRSASAELTDYLQKIVELLVKKGILPKEYLRKPIAARTELERQMSIEGIAPPEIADSTLAQIFREHFELIGEPRHRSKN